MIVAKTLDELDHYRIFGSGLALGDWVWCLHCHRVYQYGEYRTEPGGFIRNGLGCDEAVLQVCPYDGCDGSPLDLMPWADLRGCHPEHPEIPERGREYPLY